MKEYFKKVDNIIVDDLIMALDNGINEIYNGAPDKPCGVGRADANPKLLLNDT